MNKLITALSIGLFFGGVASATPFMILNRMVELAPPAGYCALGKNARQRELLEQQKKISEPAGVLLQVAVPCEDLEQFDTGAIDGFTRQAIVMFVKARGQLKLDDRPRTEFLRSLGAVRPADIAKANSHLRVALSQRNTTVALQAMTPIGSDEVAFYWSSIGEVQLEGSTQKKVASVVAALLVNGLPLSIQVSEHEGASDGAAPATVAQKYVQAIISRN